MPQNLLFACLFLATAATAQSSGSSSMHFERPVGATEATVRIQLPDGRVVAERFAVGQDIRFDATLEDGTVLGDGSYPYELIYDLSASAAQRSAARLARESGDSSLPQSWPSELPSKAGSFWIASGRFQPMLENESSRPKSRSAQAKDVVTPDDIIVQGSGCFGLDCVNNESFGFDTIRLKENNTRIGFSDTSVGAFPSNDWEIGANDSASGGLSRLYIRDFSANLTPFSIAAGAPENALTVSSLGRVGFRTAVPAFDLHLVTSNTPGIRLEQTGASGFTPQTFDIGANEANFFVRDLTAGSRLPLRIRPGAPTSSLDIASSGRVGMGTASPEAALHILRPTDTTGPYLLVARADDGNADSEDRRLVLDRDGNLFVSGSLTQLSSRLSKTNFTDVEPGELLSRLSALKIFTWNYLSADQGDRHIGPVAEDFYSAFGFGRSERSLAPADVAGVALAATQALQAAINERDVRISELETRLQRLEAAAAAAAVDKRAK